MLGAGDPPSVVTAGALWEKQVLPSATMVNPEGVLDLSKGIA